MADFGSPVAQNVDVSPQRGLVTLSSLINLRQQQQELVSQTAKASLDARVAQERTNLASVDWKQFVNPDGSLDVNTAQKTALAVAPTTGADFASRLTNMSTGGAETKAAYHRLNQEYQENLRSALGTWAGDPKSDLTDLGNQMDALKANTPASSRKDVSQIVDHTLQIIGGPDLITGAPKGLDQQKRTALAFTRAGLAPESVGGTGGLATPSAGTVATGTQVLPTTTSRMTGVTQAANAPPVANMQIPPGFQTVTDPRTGNPYLINLQTGEMRDLGHGYPGKAPGAASIAPRSTSAARPANPPPGAPPASLPSPYYPGQGQDIEAYRGEVQNIRQEAQQAPLARNINAQILRLSQDAKTGPGTDVWQQVIGAVGAPFGLSPTASYQEVGKFLEKNAIGAMQAMGGSPSDARLSAAVAANGGPSFSPAALQTVTKFNDATTTALDQYRQGIDHAVGMGKNVDYTRLPAFKAAWAKNFDVDVFRVENAIRDGDTQELAKIKAELGPARLKALAEKRKNLTALSQGQMP